MGKWWWFSAVMKFNLRFVVVVCCRCIAFSQRHCSTWRGQRRHQWRHWIAFISFISISPRMVCSERAWILFLLSSFFSVFLSFRVDSSIAFANMVNEMMNTKTTATNCWAIHQLLKINGKRRAIHWNQIAPTPRAIINIKKDARCRVSRGDYVFFLFGSHQMWIWAARLIEPKECGGQQQVPSECTVTTGDEFYLLPHAHIITTESANAKAIEKGALLLLWLCFLLTQYYIIIQTHLREMENRQKIAAIGMYGKLENDRMVTRWHYI